MASARSADRTKEDTIATQTATSTVARTTAATAAIVQNPMDGADLSSSDASTARTVAVRITNVRLIRQKG